MLTDDELLQLISAAENYLKQTTTGYLNHSTPWYSNTTTNWYRALANLDTVVSELKKRHTTSVSIKSASLVKGGTIVFHVSTS